MTQSIEKFSKYPFLDGSKSAIEDSNTSIGDALDDTTVITNAQNRIIDAINNTQLGTDNSNFYPDLQTDTQQLITYPIARILISIINQPGLNKRFGKNEAKSAIRFMEQDNVSKIEMVRELYGQNNPFEEIEHEHFDYRVSMLLFSNYTPDTPEYSLENRVLKDGYVYIIENDSEEFEQSKKYTGRKEITTILQHMIAKEVTDDLPLDVPRGIVDSMEEHTTPIKDALDMYGRSRDESPKMSVDSVTTTYLTNPEDSTKRDVVLECMELYNRGYTRSQIEDIIPNWVPDIVIDRVVDGKYLLPSENTIQSLEKH